MTKIEDIPAELRWQTATKSANMTTLALDMALRPLLGETLDQIWEGIMAEGGRQSAQIAFSLGLPAGNAIEIEDALEIVVAITLGPEFKGEIVEAAPDRLSFNMRECATKNAHEALNHPMEGTPRHCDAYCRSFVEALNPDYTISYSRRMCTGDAACEYTIERKM